MINVGNPGGPLPAYMASALYEMARIEEYRADGFPDYMAQSADLARKRADLLRAANALITEIAKYHVRGKAACVLCECLYAYDEAEAAINAVRNQV